MVIFYPGGIRFRRSAIFTSSNLVARLFDTDSTSVRVKTNARIIAVLQIPLAITRMASLVQSTLFKVMLCVVVIVDLDWRRVIVSKLRQ